MLEKNNRIKNDIINKQKAYIIKNSFLGMNNKSLVCMNEFLLIEELIKRLTILIQRYSKDNSIRAINKKIYCIYKKAKCQERLIILHQKDMQNRKVYRYNRLEMYKKIRQTERYIDLESNWYKSNKSKYLLLLLPIEYYMEWLSMWYKRINMMRKYLKYLVNHISDNHIKYHMCIYGSLRVYYYMSRKKFIFFILKQITI